MREYTPKKDAQKKAYYADRFYVSPQTPKIDIETDEIFANDLKQLSENFTIENSYIELDHLVIYINSKDNIEILEFFKNELSYDMLMELSCIDYIEQKGGFELFYELLSMSKHKRVRIKCFVKQDDKIRSVEKIFKMANWSEREMYDMFGIKVVGHHNLKRILMPNDWYGHPLLKTYPVQGDEVAQWYEVDQIFGKDNREVIGAENRDAAFIDRYDTTRFARLGHETPKGMKINEINEPKFTPKNYQEDIDRELFGIKVIKEFNKDKTIQLDKRR